MIQKVSKPPDVVIQPKTKNIIRKAKQAYQTELLHKRIDINPENIIETKRVRKPNSKYT